MPHLAHNEPRAGDLNFFVGFGVAIIEPERPVQQHHVEAEKSQHRPGAGHHEQHAGDEADGAERDHQHGEANARQRAVRGDHRGKDRGFEVVALGGGHAGQYIGMMAKKSTRKAAARKHLTKASKRKAAKVKPAPKRAKADAKIADLAAAGALPHWSKAQIEEAFRRLQAANPEPKGELRHINPFTLLVAVVLSAQATDAGGNKGPT